MVEGERSSMFRSFVSAAPFDDGCEVLHGDDDDDWLGRDNIELGPGPPVLVDGRLADAVAQAVASEPMCESIAGATGDDDAGKGTVAEPDPEGASPLLLPLP